MNILTEYVFYHYFQNISILVVLLYSWRISVNAKKYGDLEDVYYGKDNQNISDFDPFIFIFPMSPGVQIAYCAIIGTQLSMIGLSIVLLFGIYKVSNKYNFISLQSKRFVEFSFGFPSLIHID